MGKYYAVRIGKTPGVYLTCKECQAQTNGFSGAQFKSFLTRKEAENYIDGITETIPLVFNTLNKGQSLESATQKNLTNNLNPYQVSIYLDGSKIPTIGHKGMGAYCNYMGKDYKLSVTCTKNTILKYKIPANLDVLSSPSMEFLALAEVLFKFLKFRFKTYESRNEKGEVVLKTYKLEPRLNLIFIVDYNGVMHWMLNKWQAKEPHIKQIKTTCDFMADYIGARGIDTSYAHVKGHSNVYGNEMADQYAKSTEDFDTFDLLVSDVSERLLTNRSN